MVSPRGSVALQVVFARAEVHGGHAHRLRDTFAVVLLQEGVPLDDVSMLLGHSSTDITKKHDASWVNSCKTDSPSDAPSVMHRHTIFSHPRRLSKGHAQLFVSFSTDPSVRVSNKAVPALDLHRIGQATSNAEAVAYTSFELRLTWPHSPRQT